MNLRSVVVFTTAGLIVSACGLDTSPPTGPGTSGTAPTPRIAEPRQRQAPPAFAAEQMMLDEARALTVRPMAAKQAAGHPYPSTRIATNMPTDRDNYNHFDDNPLRRVAEHPVSTFSADVDTGSYTNLRRILNEGRLPPKDAVRVEEMINYFAYDDQLPASQDMPFGVTTESGPNPWNKATRLLRVGIRTPAPVSKDLPPANLVFLVDISGSMNAPNKLPLLKRALRLLTTQLDASDRVSIVTYAGASGLALDTTTGDKRATIDQALIKLQPGGSTNGASGIQLAYAKAREAFIKNGINRVILATDGDFNVGTVDHQALLDLIERESTSGIGFTALGFGRGNYNDHLLEQLADHGEGNYSYIDTLLEAKKALVDELGATLHTVARDVKLQVEFNPSLVSEYRLIGYENRVLNREDFSNDNVDAGEIGAGHSISAIYEIALSGEGGERIEPLRYQSPRIEPDASGELGHLRLRYKHPGKETSELVEVPLLASAMKEHLSQTTNDFRFTAAVAAFGQQLRGGRYIGRMTYEEIQQLARGARGNDTQGHRSDLVQLIGLALELDNTGSIDNAATSAPDPESNDG